MGDHAAAPGRLPTELAERVTQLLAQCNARCMEEVDEQTRHDVSALRHFDSLARVCFTYGALVFVFSTRPPASNRRALEKGGERLERT